MCHSHWKFKEIDEGLWFVSSKLKELKRVTSDSVLEWSNSNFLGYLQKLSVNTTLGFMLASRNGFPKIEIHTWVGTYVNSRTYKVVSEIDLVQSVWMSLALVWKQSKTCVVFWLDLRSSVKWYKSLSQTWKCVLRGLLNKTDIFF